MFVSYCFQLVFINESTHIFLDEFEKKNHDKIKRWPRNYGMTRIWRNQWLVLNDVVKLFGDVVKQERKMNQEKTKLDVFFLIA